MKGCHDFDFKDQIVAKSHLATPLLRLVNAITIKFKVFMLNLSVSRVSSVISYDCCSV